MSEGKTSQQLYRNIPVPSYQNLLRWESYAPDLMTDFRQTIEEGRDVENLRDIVEAVCRYPESAGKEDLADVLYKIMYSSPMRPGYRYREPDDIEAIRLLCSGQFNRDFVLPDKKTIRDKLTAAWRGRVCGCMLGQPVECIMTPELWLLLKHTDNWPLKRYITKADADSPVADRIEFPLRSRTYPDMLTQGFPGDDDTNYTFMASYIIDKYGLGFTSDDVCDSWKHTQVMYNYATAEKVAYRNMIAGYYAPDTALYKNPFREWIGAQIRGDYFGYINPGDPETAAEMAWRDARVSHVKNGIYGEMFVAAMNAAAMVTDSTEEIILCSMSQIPATSRLYERLQGVLDAYHTGQSWDAFLADLLKRYDEYDKHDAVHTVSNAELVAAALLWGEGDYSKTICLAVQGGFDTDCNGATAGSVIGMIVGTAGIPAKWTEPIRDNVYSGVHGRYITVSEFVDTMVRHIELKDITNGKKISAS